MATRDSTSAPATRELTALPSAVRDPSVPRWPPLACQAGGDDDNDNDAGDAENGRPPGARVRRGGRLPRLEKQNVKKTDTPRCINVAVVGLSGAEKEKGAVGIGKSCLCNRFMISSSDDFEDDHNSLLSNSDFSGRVVNNDNFLYWGEVMKTSEEGTEYIFRVIEQTEFIDDSTFQPFNGVKMDPYIKRCVATKIESAEKLMYICRSQLGVEEKFEQKVLPPGKFNIDGFLCVFDVSVVPGRSIEKQLETVTNILKNIKSTTKPVVLVTTKNDKLNEAYVQEVQKLVSRNEFKKAIPIVETSAYMNVNVDAAFIALAHIIDRFKGRTKIVPYLESVKNYY
ncbi:hypothetical protein ACI65C_003240 [Semiaphis heraclei]